MSVNDDWLDQSDNSQVEPNDSVDVEDESTNQVTAAPKRQMESPEFKALVQELSSTMGVEGTDYASGEIIIKLKQPTVSTPQINDLQTRLSANVKESTQTMGIQRWEIQGMSVAEAIALYGNDPAVEYIEPNYFAYINTTTPNDPEYNRLWGLNNTGQTGGTADADIDAPEAWDIETGNNIVVGVIDSGVDYNHPDLNDNMWTNPGEIAGNGIDDDNNGYVDDIYGWDFVNNDNDPFDDNSHGTHVAGTIAAEGNNGIGVTGVSWSADIMALKFLGASNSGSYFDAIQAIEYATMMGADLTNNSWRGYSFSQGLRDAIAAANNAGQLFVAAAGNENNNNDTRPAYPASYNLSNIISVASTDDDDQRSGFSNFGSTSVDLGAPGSSVYSTIPGGGYGFKSGTSMATPHVSGVASLIWSDDPTLTAQQVKDRILATVDPISDLQGITVTGGRLNAYSALTGSTPLPVLPVLFDDFDPDIDNSQWSNITNGTANSNFVGSDGNSLWFNGGSPGGSSRFAITNLVDVANGGTITFDLIFGNSSNGGENADPGEDVVLEYSTNGGSTWNQFGLYDTEAFTSWTTLTETIPTAAQTNSTSFRWRQIAHSGNNFDNWAIDNVTVGPPILNSVVDDFDPDIDNSQWSTITNGTVNSNFVGSDGNSLWFSGGSSGGNSRFATTNFVDVSSGGTVFFDLIFGNSSNGGENADPGEDVVLEYSINGGTSWTRMGLYDTEDFTSWTTLIETVPTAAQTSSTSFRWRQVNHSGSSTDNWAIDDVFVGVPTPGEISGSKWNDLNGDGKQDANEPGLAGWTIYLDDNQNGQLDSGETSTKTDINGDYTFTNLNPGTYTVAEVLKPGWEQTFPGVSAGILDGFEDGNLSEYTQTSLTGTIASTLAAHDGTYGLLDGSAGGWLYRNDSEVSVQQGDSLSVWVNLANAANGRAYFGFGASAAGTLSAVLAPNTNQLIIQENNSFGFRTIATVSQNYISDKWYKLDVDWGVGGNITTELFDSDGTTLLNSVTGTSNLFTSGGIAFRGFSSDKYFDTVTLENRTSGVGKVLKPENLPLSSGTFKVAQPVLGNDVDSVNDVPVIEYQLSAPWIAGTVSPDQPGSQPLQKPGNWRTQPLNVQLADLSGVDILYDRSHGQRSSGSFSTIIGDLTARGAAVDENFDPIDTVLANYDILWVDEGGSTTWTVAEQTAVKNWVQAGNSLLLHGDQVNSGEVLATLFDINYTGINGTAGLTTNIFPHPVTDQVNQVNVSAPLNSLSVSGSASTIVNDVGQTPHISVNTFGAGAVIAVADDDFFNSIIGVGDNQMLANQAFDWLAVGGGTVPGTHKVELRPGQTVTNIDFGNQKIPPQTLFGTNGNDVFTITDSPVIVFALGGHDQVDGSASAGGNLFYGGKGNDTLIGNSYDQLFGEVGNDRLDVSNGAGNNLLDGGKGKDELLANLNDQLFGGQGHDTLDASSGGGNNLLDGGKGNDVLLAGSNDHLLGGKGDDNLDASSGGGNNLLDGGKGDDVLLAGSNDQLLGGIGDDILNALNGGGNNVLDGGKGDDNLLAGSNDQLLGGDGDDILNASVGTGNNSLDGGDGDDNLLAGFNDQLSGGDGDDILNASFGSGNNSLDGGDGDDILIASFNDQLSGGDGDDLLFGGDGGSTMTGGNGDEQFWIVNGFVPSAVHTITDFEVEIDRIGIRGLGITFQQLDLIQDGNDTRISVFNTDLAILTGIQASTLDSSDFILA
jgi:subtilisin family serine protease